MHRIKTVEHWTPYGDPDANMFQITFTYQGEEHTMLCAERNGEVNVSHTEQLDATSEMDELVMENMASEFIENCWEYFHES